MLVLMTMMVVMIGTLDGRPKISVLMVCMRQHLMQHEHTEYAQEEKGCYFFVLLHQDAKVVINS